MLAARDAPRLETLADQLGRLDTAVADADRPDPSALSWTPVTSWVSTVGPLARYGEPAVEPAIAAGASYLDSTREGPFVREVVERHGSRAHAAGCALLTAFGYDFVPGNLAGALALRDAGDSATHVDVGYFTLGRFATAAGRRPRPQA